MPSLASRATSRRRARAVRATHRMPPVPSHPPASAPSVFKRGPKASNAADAHEKSTLDRVARAVDTARRAWSAPRGASASALPCAVWRPEVSRAEVVRTRGRHFHRFGCARGDATWLFPEECAFLVETERLALFMRESDEEPASVRAVYALCARSGVSREEYLAYGYLLSLIHI